MDPRKLGSFGGSQRQWQDDIQNITVENSIQTTEDKSTGKNLEDDIIQYPVVYDYRLEEKENDPAKQLNYIYNYRFITFCVFRFPISNLLCPVNPGILL
ncbi:unnamed protein product [Ceutorhynchus assimilis]|uniref:Uncharacterized protein n=1 Tax=Ceutorhynchus assimilis TaxID=467358 RepID=A0A9N9QKN8_9CUCU|nr:unnamed protein product [Ceutorhynchus assimilis]